MTTPKPTHGGSRKGAGRPKQGKVRLCLYVSPETVKAINKIKRRLKSSQGDAVAYAVQFCHMMTKNHENWRNL